MSSQGSLPRQNPWRSGDQGYGGDAGETPELTSSAALPPPPTPPPPTAAAETATRRAEDEMKESDERLGKECDEHVAAPAANTTGSPSSVVQIPPKRRRPWLRVFFGLFAVIELAMTIIINEYSPVHDFEITPVTGTDWITVVGNNPELLYPIKLGGSLCRPADLTACVADDVSLAMLETVCCSELLDPSSSGPEQLISPMALLGYVLVIPGLVLLVRGYLLGRVWALWPLQHSFCSKPNSDGGAGEGAWDKRRWHLRVGFYALDSCLGLLVAIVTVSFFTTVGKVTVGLPRPNYFALRLFSDNAANGQTYYEEGVLGWPSGHASIAMAGLLFLSFILWRDLMALVQWRRRAHPKVTLVLAVLGGFVVATLPLSAILIGITRIRGYWDRPGDVLAGLVLGSAAAHWAFRFVVLMPFNHEIGTPHFRPDPRWEEEEDREWQEEQEEMDLCIWPRGRRNPRIRADSESDNCGRTKKPASVPTQVPRPTRAREADELAVEKSEYSPV